MLTSGWLRCVVSSGSSSNEPIQKYRQVHWNEGLRIYFPTIQEPVLMVFCSVGIDISYLEICLCDTLDVFGEEERSAMTSLHRNRSTLCDGNGIGGAYPSKLSLLVPIFLML